MNSPRPDEQTAPNAKGQASLARTLIGVVGVLVSLGFLAIAGWHVDWTEALAKLRAATWWPWLPLAVGTYLVGQIMRGVRCRLLVWQQARLSYATATNIVVVGYAVNNILPFRLGEFARAGMLAERTGLPYAQSLAITFLERVLDALVILGLFALGLAFLPATTWGVSLALPVAVVVGGVAVIITVIALSPHNVTAVVSRLTGVLPAKVHDRIVALVAQVSAGFACIQSAGTLVGILILSVVVWVLECGLFLFAMMCFGLEVNLPLVAFAMAATNLFVLLPAFPGHVGTFDLAAKTALVTFGVAASSALGVAVVAHLAFYVPVTLWGVAAMAWYGVELGSARAVARAAPALTSLPGVPSKVITLLGQVTPDPKPSAFMTAVCEGLLPERRLEGARDRDEVLGRVSAFVNGELNALPGKYRLLLHVGLTGFSFLVFLLTWRPFARVTLERRRAILRWWAWGPVALTRQLFRAVRSTTVLAYYEDPLVQAGMSADAISVSGFQKRRHGNV